MRTLCASTLIGEFFVIGFAGLVAMKEPDLSTATVWTVCGVLMALSVLLCGMITRPGGVQLGWRILPDTERSREHRQHFATLRITHRRQSLQRKAQCPA